MTELEYYDQKAERHLGANDFSNREWAIVKAFAITVLLIVGIAVWGWLG